MKNEKHYYTEWIEDIPVHPYAATYPMMSGEELQELADDIKANGQREPIVLAHMDGIHDEQVVVIDGRNRFRACQIAGVEPEFRTDFLISGDDIGPWIDSKNLHRRHLTPEQKRERIKAALSRNPELPDYQIAKRTNTSPHTVKRVRQDNPDLQSANERVNARGQKRPATYSRVPVEVDRELEAAARAKSSAPDSGPYVTGDSASSRNGQRLKAIALLRKVNRDLREVAAIAGVVGGFEGGPETVSELRGLLDTIDCFLAGDGLEAFNE